MNFVVNSLGEVVEGPPAAPVVVGSVNVTELEKRLQRKPQRKDFDREFNRLAEEALGSQAEIVKKIWRLQRVNNARCRFYGGVRRGKTWGVLATEFVIPIKDRRATAALKILARKHNLRLDLMTVDRREKTRQFSVERELDPMSTSLRALRAAKRDLQAATASFWPTYGVNVI